MFVIPIIMVLSMANVTRRITQRRYRRAFLSSSFSISLLFILVAIELYPSLVLSTLNPAWSMTVKNSSASEKSLGIMLIVAAIGVPLVGIYTSFVFWTFKGKVKLDETSY